MTIKKKVSIENRFDIINSQSRYGDWEIDTIIGKDQKGAILTLTERKPDFLMMRKFPKGKQAQPLAKKVVILFITCKTIHIQLLPIMGQKLPDMNTLQKKN